MKADLRNPLIKGAWLAIAAFACGGAVAASTVLPQPTLMEVAATPAGRELTNAFAAGRYAEAEAAAGRMLADATTATGPVAPKPLALRLNLAATQYHAGAHTAAVASYEQALTQIRVGLNSRDPRLVKPLLGLGAAAFRSGDLERAVTALARAAFISRTQAGLNNREQLRGYDALIAALTRLGQIDAAERRQRTRLSVVAAAAGPDSDDYAGALDRAAEWFQGAGRYPEALELQLQRMRLLREQYGDDDPALVPVLRAIADACAPGEVPGRVGLRALDRAQRIQQDTADTTAADRATIRLARGDLFLRYGAERLADREYRRAYALLAEARDNSGLARLARPVPVYWPPAREDQPLPVENTLLTIDVDRDGQVFNAALQDAGQAGGERAVEVVEQALFRPRITADGAISRTGVDYEYRFSGHVSGD